jgi:DNA polymerase delta subunit 3
MKSMSEDEDDDFVMVEEGNVDDAKVEAARAERAERQKRLRDMMDDDDEPMADVPSVDEAVDDGSPIDSKVEDEEPKETVTVTGGRRRGRRRVMKKKTMKDEEGYLGKRILCNAYSCAKLTGYSDQGRSGMGILLGRRATA